MSTQIAEAKLAHSPAATIAAAAIGRSRADDILDEERPLAVARGILSAVLISVPFWALLAFTLYLLI